MTMHFQRAREGALNNRVRVSAHSFRKFNTTALEGAGVPQEWVKILQGKAAYVYSRPQDDDTLLKAYAKAYDSLRILPSEHLESQVQSLTQDLNDLKAMMEELTNLNPQLREYYLKLRKIEKETGDGVFTDTPTRPEE